MKLRIRIADAALILAIFAGICLIFWVACLMDLWFNPWLEKSIADFRWYNYFTTKHGLTAIYLTSKTVWFSIVIVFSAIATVIYSAIFWD